MDGVLVEGVETPGCGGRDDVLEVDLGKCSDPYEIALCYRVGRGGNLCELHYGETIIVAIVVIIIVVMVVGAVLCEGRFGW